MGIIETENEVLRCQLKDLRKQIREQREWLKAKLEEPDYTANSKDIYTDIIKAFYK